MVSRPDCAGAVEQVWLLHRYDMGCPGDHGELAVWHPASQFVGVRNGDEVVIADDDQHRCSHTFEVARPVERFTPHLAHLVPDGREMLRPVRGDLGIHGGEHCHLRVVGR
jgi:hypothetical protein